VRYRVESSFGQEEFCAKLLSDGDAATQTYLMLHAVHDQVFAGAADLRVPQPVGIDENLAVVLYRPMSGIPLDALRSAAELERGARLTALWLARLHRAEIPMERSLDLGAEVQACSQWAGLVGQRLSALAGTARLLATRIKRATSGVERAELHPIHSNFHPGLVVMASGGIAVDDLDEARLGDPALDVAHFCRNLELLGMQPEATHLDVPAALTAFLDAYNAAAGPVDDKGMRFYSAWACLKLARQVATGTGPRPHVVPSRRAAVTEELLRKGLEWLA
jgi:aminoglycoside phosphotransferase (APT) family kinase protein